MLLALLLLLPRLLSLLLLLHLQLITSRELEFPEGAAAFQPAAQDLIEQLLQLEPSKRLGEWAGHDVKT